MAKRKAARSSSRKRAPAGRGSRGAAKAVRKAAASKKTARKAAKPVRRASAKKRAAPKGASRKAVLRKTGARRNTAGKSAARKVAARKGVARRLRGATRPLTVARRTSAPPKAAAPKAASVPRRTAPAAPPAKPLAPKKTRLPARTAPGLNRARRTVIDDDLLLPSPPSSLDLDRTASAARSGRKELLEKYEEHTETSPALTAGDVDADWESAYSVGDEAPGGDNPTPDQDIVDEIGRAVGVQYQDNEELKGAKKITERDRHRWELDPASSDDWEDR